MQAWNWKERRGASHPVDRSFGSLILQSSVDDLLEKVRGPRPRHKRKGTRRERFLALSAKLGKRLDELGVTDEDIQRDFEAWKKARRGR
jgi:hypothetical protein